MNHATESSSKNHANVKRQNGRINQESVDYLTQLDWRCGENVSK